MYQLINSEKYSSNDFLLCTLNKKPIITVRVAGYFLYIIEQSHFN